MLERYADENIVNVPNAITGVRLSVSLAESTLYAQTGDVKHFVLAGAAYFLDMIDGPAARAFDQETDFGADFDPVADKLSIGGLVVSALMQRTIDRPVLAVVAAINVSNVLATFVAEKRGVLQHDVPQVGKLSQLVMNGGLGANVIGNDLIKNSSEKKQRTRGHVLRAVGATAAIGGAATLGLQATATYWKRALRAPGTVSRREAVLLLAQSAAE
jgi:phosphatidylglycerophosphate synthase